MQKGQAVILVLVGILVLVVAGGVYLFGQSQTPKLQPQSQTGEYQVFGTLDKEATAEDQQILQSSVKQLSVSFGLLESFPAQFQIVTKDINSCEEVRKVLATFKFVQNFGECQKRQIPQNPNQPVSNEPTPQATPSDETANPDSIGVKWKTYINTKYGYSLKYPTKIFTGVVEMLEDERGDICLDNQESNSSVDADVFQICISSLQTQKTVEEVINQLTAPQGDVLTPKKIDIGGKTGYKVSGAVHSIDEVGVVDIYVQNKTGILFISLTPYFPKTNRDRYEWPQMFDQIISTFRFTQ